MVAGLVGTQVVHAIQFVAKCCCHRKQKNYKLNGKRTLYWTILILCVYIFIIGIGCFGIGWGMGSLEKFLLALLIVGKRVIL